MPLEKQVVLITGCSSGIGRALSRELADRGHRVFPSARRPETIEDLRSDRVEPLALDVTDPDSISKAVRTVLDVAGHLDILVNNAGINTIGPTPEIPVDDVRRNVETNLVGPLALIQAVFPHMADRGSGRIVNVGSVVGVVGTPFVGPYAATKAGLHMLSDVLRMEVAPFGIDVVVVQPGAIRSSMGDNASRGVERYRDGESRYRPVAGSIAERARLSQRNPTPTGDFARTIADAITRTRPPRRVRAGSHATLLPALGTLLPRAALDRIFSRRFGLTKLGDADS